MNQTLLDMYVKFTNLSYPNLCNTHEKCKTKEACTEILHAFSNLLKILVRACLMILSLAAERATASLHV
jgi:hypothetical protein